MFGKAGAAYPRNGDRLSSRSPSGDATAVVASPANCHPEGTLHGRFRVRMGPYGQVARQHGPDTPQDELGGRRDRQALSPAVPRRIAGLCRPCREGLLSSCIHRAVIRVRSRHAGRVRQDGRRASLPAQDGRRTDKLKAFARRHDPRQSGRRAPRRVVAAGGGRRCDRRQLPRGRHRHQRAHLVQLDIVRRHVDRSGFVVNKDGYPRWDLNNMLRHFTLDSRATSALAPAS